MVLRVANTVSVPRVNLQATVAGAATQIPVPYISQTENNWCWAACCEMVFKYYGGPMLQQCDLASSQFGQNCCVTPSSAGCDRGEWPDNVYPKHRFGFVRTNSALPLSVVQAELSQGRPVEVYYAWRQGGAHVALITGVFANGDVWVHDPWAPYGSGRRAFSFVLSAYNLGTWSITYSQIVPPAQQGGTV